MTHHYHVSFPKQCYSLRVSYLACVAITFEDQDCWFPLAETCLDLPRQDASSLKIRIAGSHLARLAETCLDQLPVAWRSGLLVPTCLDLPRLAYPSCQ